MDSPAAAQASHATERFPGLQAKILNGLERPSLGIYVQTHPNLMNSWLQYAAVMIVILT